MHHERMKRRDFLKATSAAGALAVAPSSLAGAGPIHAPHHRPLKILFLGGTDFVGPAIIDVAVARGHDVTLFNRGQTNPWLFTWLERLKGNRFPDRNEGLAALRGDRTWDIVIDTWQGNPLLVKKTAELLRDRVGAYFYISSIAVYQDLNYRKASFDETAELPPARMPDSPDAEQSYPVRKQLGEAAALDVFGDRAAIFRAYGIQGVDATGKLSGINYWPVRVIVEGGRVLAPGDGDDFTQWTDVRDLADFVVHALENRIRGIYNVSTGTTFRNFLEGLARLAPHEVRFQWAPVEFLADRGVEEFTDIPGFVWRKSWGPGFFYASTERALEAGLRPRTIRQTFGPMIDAYRLHHADHDLRDPESGPEIGVRESELLGELGEL